jgi:hypothetical protein
MKTPDGSSQQDRQVMFDVEKVRRAAGDKVFARGLEYQRQGLVDIVSIAARRVRARVLGSETYSTEVDAQTGDPGGRCSCPAYRDFGFCKHMVAAALAANDAAAQGVEDETSVIGAYLGALDKKTLIDLILDLAERDAEIARKLALRAAASKGDADAFAKKLRKEIDTVTRTSGFVDYADAGAWADRVEDAIESVESFIAGGSAALALPLIDRLSDRVAVAGENIDDSDGRIGYLLEKAARLHLAACVAAKPDPLVLARDLLARELDGDIGYELCIAGYAEALGAAGQAEMARLAAKAWEEIAPARPGARGGYDEGRFVRERLAAILDFLAEQRGDLDTRIAIRSKHLSLPFDYLNLAEFCDEHGRGDDASKWVEEALFVFEDEPDERLTMLAADLFRRRKRPQDAEAALWRAFAKRPSRALYDSIVAPARAAKRKAATDRAIDILKSAATSRGGHGAQWAHLGASDLVLSILASEKRFDDAWSFAKTTGGSDRSLRRLADETGSDHPKEATAVYRRCVDAALARGGEPAYRDARDLILRLRTIAERAGMAEDHAAYEARLLQQHRAKRNFIKIMGGPGRSERAASG